MVNNTIPPGSPTGSTRPQNYTLIGIHFETNSPGDASADLLPSRISRSRRTGEPQGERRA